MPTPRLLVVAFAAATVIATLAPAGAQTSPKPSGTPHPLPTPHLPTHPLHTEYLVEVNKKGQAVKVKPVLVSAMPGFNTMTFGNAQQMWIRKQDGSATVGTFKVWYDYDPKTHMISRNFSLVSTGGTWGDEEGLANQIIDLAKKEAAQDAASQAAAEEKARKNLQNYQNLNQIIGQPTPAPSPTPTI